MASWLAGLAGLAVDWSAGWLGGYQLAVWLAADWLAGRLAWLLAGWVPDGWFAAGSLAGQLSGRVLVDRLGVWLAEGARGPMVFEQIFHVRNVLRYLS